MSAVVGMFVSSQHTTRPPGGAVLVGGAEDACVEFSKEGWYSSWKATTDAALAGLLLVLTAPLMLLAAVLVKLTSRGPVFYTQTRLGCNGRSYRIIKIRTMIHDCERLTGPQWCVVGDRRITRVGRFLRATHLDELPQLWNVIRGDMSLVGPRPERPEIARELARVIPHYCGRLLVRPGLSGLAQVQLAPDTDLASVRRKLAYDLHYLRHSSLSFDLRLILATLLHMFHLPFGIAHLLLRVPGSNEVERLAQSAPLPEASLPVIGWQATAATRHSVDAGQGRAFDLSKMAESELEVLAWQHGYFSAATELILRRYSPRLQMV